MKKIIGFLVIAFLLTTSVTYADVTVGDLGDARLVTGTTNSRDDNNGGNTVTGALIGLNTGGVDNVMLYDFSDLSAASGQTYIGATVSIAVATGFTNGNHGTVDDIINLHEIALTNLGWDNGTGVIGGSDNFTDDGSVSFLNRVQYNDDPGPAGGTTEQWLDAGGTGVSNILGALTLLDSISGYNSGGGTPFLVFDIDAATAQAWADNGLGGFALTTTDNGDSRSRFNMAGAGATITFHSVPEPGSVAVLGSLFVLTLVRRRR